MFHSFLFKIGYSIKDRDFLRCYNLIKKNEYKSRDFLQDYQEDRLRKIIHYSYEKIPYYHRLFKSIDLKPEQIKSVEDLEKIPILTKEHIFSHYNEFMPIDLESNEWVRGTTGGSTGEPLQYRMTKKDAIMGLAIMYANWDWAGYKLGDKIAVIAGSSIFPNTGFKMVNSIKAFMLNEKRYSSFDLSHEFMDRMVTQLNKFKPDFIRGYVSSICLFADHIKERKIKINFQPKAVFTTAEVLFEHQRNIIEEVFGCKAFDQYGLNDGGVTAYECGMHNGMHIDMLRSIMEIVDDNGHGVEQGKEGHILATSLHNYAFPFIRYNTQDMGIPSDKVCTCGRKTPMLSKVRGRMFDFVLPPNGKLIHGEFFAHIFWEIEWAKQFQVVQKEKNKLIIRIVPKIKDGIKDEYLEKMKKIIYNRTGPMEIEFEIVDKIEPSPSGKWRFIIRETP